MPARKVDFLRLLVNVGLLFPLALLVWDLTNNQLSANPIEAATRRMGKTALILLLLSLACTPVFSLLGLRTLRWLRRTLGLWAFAYACIHLTIFVGLDYGLDLDLLREAALEKRYALAGLSAFLLLTPLAVTSTTGWRRRLGPTWTRLHWVVYIAAPLAVTHYLWGVKLDRRQPLAYGAAVLILLLLRLHPIRQIVRVWRCRSVRQRALLGDPAMSVARRKPRS
ncbi:MAG: ferric reductase-like transmembrane domain-containing protein [Chloroflexi bacterium]|nr:ferric reductase-like transmembrane domain-containing protein [Chloroflexota bacterium]